MPSRVLIFKTFIEVLSPPLSLELFPLTLHVRYICFTFIVLKVVCWILVLLSIYFLAIWPHKGYCHHFHSCKYFESGTYVSGLNTPHQGQDISEEEPHVGVHVLHMITPSPFHCYLCWSDEARRTTPTTSCGGTTLRVSSGDGALLLTKDVTLKYFKDRI